FDQVVHRPLARRCRRGRGHLLHSRLAQPDCAAHAQSRRSIRGLRHRSRAAQGQGAADPLRALELLRLRRHQPGPRHRPRAVRTAAAAMTKLLRLAALFVLLVVLLGAAAGGAYLWFTNAVTAPGPLNAPVTVLIPPGAGVQAVARKVAEAGVIASG